MSLRALVKGWVGEAMGTLAHRLLDTRVYQTSQREAKNA